MEKRTKKISYEKMLFAVGVGLLVFAIVVIATAFTFLINNVLPAVNPDEKLNGGEEIHFNLEGFEKLRL